VPRPLVLSAVLGLVVASGLVACGGDDPDAGRPSNATGATGTSPSPADNPATTVRDADAEGESSRGDATPTSIPPRRWTATCPTATTSPLGCRGVRGRVLSIQSYDPDGDGDLHVVAVGGDVTLPGITVFDVRPSLRPRRDPVKGEYVTGAGPVFRGSLGQRQIQVDVFRVWRP
jgi:hypothetical protein